MQPYVRVVPLVGAVLLAGACGGEKAAPAPAASTTPAVAEPRPAGEPLFKPIDPSAAPVVPQAGPNTATFPQVTPGGGGGAVPIAMVTDMAAGWPVTLQVGQSMTARLGVDAASGARWALRPGSDAGVVKLEGPPASEAPPGAPAVEVFTLKAIKPGQTSLTFDLRKGSEPTALKSVSYPITVQ